MSGLLVGFWGIYLILLGRQGNVNKFLDLAQSDSSGFVPWAIAIGILGGLMQVDTLKPIVTPFVLLVLLTFFLHNYNKIVSQFHNLGVN